MLDMRHWKLRKDETGRPINRKPETKFTELQRFLDRTEFYIEKCVYVTGDYMGLPLILQESECKKIEWVRYNSMVGSAVRIWEKYPDCSKPPANNPNPLNGLRTLLIWATEELKNAGVNTEQKLKQASEQKKDEKAKSPPEGERSKPMKKSKMMVAIGIDSYKTFNAWAKDKEIKPAGNRQTFTIRLDILDTATRQKLEKA